MMAGRTVSLGVGTHEIDFMKETLQAQQELLQKLYTELDVERESSATAADETLSMILRLQGEKSAMEMEASQYKRIAEEKMCHAQEMVETFQEIIYQKEMQIASLEFQVQSYRFKLASLGYDDLGSSDVQYPENMLSRRNGVVGETSGGSSIRRGNSVPPIANGELSRRASTEGARTETSSPKMFQENRVEPLRRSSTQQGDFNSYWEEIKKLDERVKGFGYTNDVNGFPTDVGAKDPSPDNSPCHPSPDKSPEKTVLNLYPDKVLNVQACVETPCSPSVHDIFEVPQCPIDDFGDTSHKDEPPEMISEKETVNEKLDSAWDEVWKSKPKMSIDWEKQPLLSPDVDGLLHKSKDVEAKIGVEKKPLLSPMTYGGLPKHKDGKTDIQSLFKHPTLGVADFELQQFNRRLKQLEDERFVTRGREISFETGDEELKLLREIVERVEAVQSEITSWKTEKPPSPEDRSFGCFKEVMFCFLPKS